MDWIDDDHLDRAILQAAQDSSSLQRETALSSQRSTISSLREQLGQQLASTATASRAEEELARALAVNASLATKVRQLQDLVQQLSAQRDTFVAAHNDTQKELAQELEDNQLAVRHTQQLQKSREQALIRGAAAIAKQTIDQQRTRITEHEASLAGLRSQLQHTISQGQSDTRAAEERRREAADQLREARAKLTARQQKSITHINELKRAKIMCSRQAKEVTSLKAKLTAAEKRIEDYTDLKLRFSRLEMVGRVAAKAATNAVQVCNCTTDACTGSCPRRQRRPSVKLHFHERPGCSGDVVGCRPLAHYPVTWPADCL